MGEVVPAEDLGLAVESARAALREQRWADAADCWAEVLKRDVGIAEAHAGRGLALIKIGRSTEAVECLRQAVELNPADVKSLSRLAVAAAKPSPVVPVPRSAVRAAGRTQRDSIGEVLALAHEFGFVPQTIIDVGVNTGTPGLYDDFPAAKYLLIDPLAENEVFMKHMCSTLADGHYVVAAAGARPGTTTISVHPGIGGSRLAEAVGRHSDGEDREVPVVTIDELCARHGAKGPFVIKVDVEGAELVVLEGAAQTLASTEMLILETRLVRIGRAPDLTETLAFLDQRNFATYDIIDRNYHKVDRTLKQFDLVAVRKEGYFRTGNANRRFIDNLPEDFAAKIVSGKLSKRRRKLDEIVGAGGQAADTPRAAS